MNLIGLLICVAIAAGFARPAQSAIITADFEQVDPAIGSPGFVYSNITSGGFRLSPACHVHHMQSGGYSDSNWISWDPSGCGFGGTTNLEYVGEQAGDYLHVDYFGNPFTLESVFFVSRGGVKSSKGGEFETSVEDEDSLVSFDGPEWTGITWLLFEGCLCGAPDSGIDQLTVSVPEPASPAVFATALIVLGVVARRRRVAAC